MLIAVILWGLLCAFGSGSRLAQKICEVVRRRFSWQIQARRRIVICGKLTARRRKGGSEELCLKEPRAGRLDPAKPNRIVSTALEWRAWPASRTATQNRSTGPITIKSETIAGSDRFSDFWESHDARESESDRQTDRQTEERERKARPPRKFPLDWRGLRLVRLELEKWSEEESVFRKILKRKGEKRGPTGFDEEIWAKRRMFGMFDSLRFNFQGQPRQGRLSKPEDYLCTSRI